MPGFSVTERFENLGQSHDSQMVGSRPEWGGSRVSRQFEKLGFGVSATGSSPLNKNLDEARHVSSQWVSGGRTDHIARVRAQGSEMMARS